MPAASSVPLHLRGRGLSATAETGTAADTRRDRAPSAPGRPVPLPPSAPGPAAVPARFPSPVPYPVRCARALFLPVLAAERERSVPREPSRRRARGYIGPGARADVSAGHAPGGGRGRGGTGTAGSGHRRRDGAGGRSGTDRPARLREPPLRFLSGAHHRGTAGPGSVRAGASGRAHPRFPLSPGFPRSPSRLCRISSLILRRCPRC